MVVKIIISVVIFICALVSYAYFRLWQGGNSGRNYMRNEYDIREDDIENSENNNR